MARRKKQDTILITIEDTLGILEDNFKLEKKVLKPSDIYTLIESLDKLFSVYQTLDFPNCLKLCKIRYIPALKLLVTIEKEYDFLIKYMEFLKNAYRICAKDDLESFIIYYEWEKKDKFYTIRIDFLQGFVYYLNKMIHDEEFEGIIANLPSGWGKTYLVDLASAFSYGIDENGTILALCSNEDVVNGNSRTIKEIIQSEEFGEIFPHLKWNKEDKEYFKKDSESVWRLRNCTLPASFYAKTTKANVVGCRASKYVWVDDLYADYKEALNESDNKYFFNKFLSVWRKRFIQEAKVWKFIITGTMWSPTDFIVKVIKWLEGRYKFVPHKVFKYTRVSENGKFAIIQVPALNVETNKSNCEELAPTKILLNEKASLDTYIFECNYQQNPVSPEALAFDYKNLKMYQDRKPIEYGALAVIDGTRKSGKDFFSMPIFTPYGEDFALIDAIYTQVATSKLTDRIIDMIMTYNIKILVIETNVDGGLKSLIEERLSQIGYYNGIKIIEKYSTMVKAVRIELERGNMLDRIYYPNNNLYAPNSELGRFMTSFTMYNIEGGNIHDDANDSVAMFSAEIIGGKSKPIKPVILARPF